MFLLHISYANGAARTIPCATRFERALLMVALAAQPVQLRTEDQ